MSDMPGETVSTTPCPMCLAQGQTQYLRNRAGRFETYCQSGHAWNDTEELHAAVNAAKMKHPDKFPAAKAAPVAELPQHLIIDPATKKLLEETSGQQINSVSELKGILWAMKSQVQEAREEANRARAQAVAAGMRADHEKATQPGTVPSDGVVLSIPEWCISTVEEHAGHEQKTVQQYLQEQFTGFLEGYYNPLAMYQGRG